jgi:hypothetical protein
VTAGLRVESVKKLGPLIDRRVNRDRQATLVGWDVGSLLGRLAGHTGPRRKRRPKTGDRALSWPSALETISGIGLRSPNWPVSLCL